MRRLGASRGAVQWGRRSGSESRTVVVSWSINCSVGDGTYSGNLYLVDAVTRERICLIGGRGADTLIGGSDRRPGRSDRPGPRLRERRAGRRRGMTAAGQGLRGPRATFVTQAAAPATRVT
jgi:hypothetical protein